MVKKLTEFANDESKQVAVRLLNNITEKQLYKMKQESMQSYDKFAKYEFMNRWYKWQIFNEKRKSINGGKD